MTLPPKMARTKMPITMPRVLRDELVTGVTDITVLVGVAAIDTMVGGSVGAGTACDCVMTEAAVAVGTPFLINSLLPG